MTIPNSVKDVQKIIDEFNHYTKKYEMLYISIAPDMIAYNIIPTERFVSTLNIVYSIKDKTIDVDHVVIHSIVDSYKITPEELKEFNLTNLSNFDLLITICDNMLERYDENHKWEED